MKKRMALVLAGFLTFSLAACSTGEASAPASKSAESTATTESASTTAVDGVIGFSVSTQNNPYFVTLAEGVTKKASDLGVEVITVDAGDDSAKQASDIEDLVSKGIAVLIVNPVDSDAVTPAIKDVIAAGIHVIAVDRTVNGVEIDSQIASDNAAGGRLAGEHMLELLGEGAKVVELEGIPGASSTIERGGGFNEIAKDKLDIVASQTANFNRAEGLTVTENLLQAHPDIKGIFAHNDEMALGALEAVETAGKDIVIIGFDATDDALTAIKDGRMTATIAQKPALMGETAVETAVQIMSGETVEKVIGVDVELVTK